MENLQSTDLHGIGAYRIIVEALTNVVKHAGAQNCTIHMWIGEGSVPYGEMRIPSSVSRIPVQLCIEMIDDGSGLPTGYHAGVGLSAMRERALELGGAVELESVPGQGTAVHVSLPITAS